MYRDSKAKEVLNSPALATVRSGCKACLRADPPTDHRSPRRGVPGQAVADATAALFVLEETRVLGRGEKRRHQA